MSAPPLPADRPGAWPVRGTRDLHRGTAPFALREDRIAGPDDAADEEGFPRLVLEHPGAAVVLAVDDQDRVVVLQQYRHPVAAELVELPAGLCDVPGEDPLQVAQRELAEEVGLAADDWTPLGSAYSTPGISAELIHYFLARGLREEGRGDFVPEHEEASMQVSRVPLAALRSAVLDGSVRDAPTVLALLLAGTRGLLPQP